MKLNGSRKIAIITLIWVAAEVENVSAFKIKNNVIDQNYHIIAEQTTPEQKEPEKQKAKEKIASLTLVLGSGNMYSGTIGVRGGVSLKAEGILIEPFVAYGVGFLIKDVKLPYPNILGQSTETVIGSASGPGAGLKLSFPLASKDEGKTNHLVFIAPTYGLSAVKVWYKIECKELLPGRITCSAEKISERGINGLSLLGGYSFKQRVLLIELALGINWTSVTRLGIALSIGAGINFDL